MTRLVLRVLETMTLVLLTLVLLTLAPMTLALLILAQSRLDFRHSWQSPWINRYPDHAKYDHRRQFTALTSENASPQPLQTSSVFSLFSVVGTLPACDVAPPDRLNVRSYALRRRGRGQT